MTPDEARKRINKLWVRKIQLNEEVAKAARPIVAVLLDAGRSNSAKMLQELFFQLDANQEELSQFLREHPEAVIASLVWDAGKSQ